MYVPQEQLNGRITFYWRISRLFRTAFFSIPFSVVIFFSLLTITNIWIAISISILFIAHRFFYTLIWPSFEHIHYRFEIRENDILVQNGVLFRKWSSIPLHRIQHVDTHQGPLQRIVGLVTLQIYTAAGSTFDGSIPGLRPDRAQELQQLIITNRGDDGV